jgi:hypothetical protein
MCSQRLLLLPENRWIKLAFNPVAARQTFSGCFVDNAPFDS